MVIRDFNGRQVKIAHNPRSADLPPWRAEFASRHDSDPQWLDQIAGYGDSPDEAYNYLILAFTNRKL